MRDRGKGQINTCIICIIQTCVTNYLAAGAFAALALAAALAHAAAALVAALVAALAAALAAAALAAAAQLVLLILRLHQKT